MNKNDNLNDISDKLNFKNQKKSLKITNKDLNHIDFLNFQNYFNLIKKIKNHNLDISPAFIENLYDINNSYKKQKISPASLKLLNDIKQITHHVYKDKNSNNNNKEQNKKFMDKYNIIINSINSNNHNPTNKTQNLKNDYKLKNKYPIKIYLSKDKNTINNKDKPTINIDENIFENQKIKKLRNNTVDSIYNNKKNIKRIKYEYGNYALNTMNFNHPQFYILNCNNNNNDNDNDNVKNKLPLIETSNGFKFRRSGDLSYLIPYNNKKINVRKNFYNYYIGMKLSKNNFNI